MFRSFEGLLRLSFLITVVGLAGCASPPEGIYRFQAAIENSPVAYRNVRAGEPLQISVKFENFSDKYVKIARPSDGSGGMDLLVSASSASGFIGRAIVKPGLRAGQIILPDSAAAAPLWFDSHNPAVQDLASTGAVLLHLNSDTVQNSLSLYSNEAAFTVDVPINWNRVPNGAPGTSNYAVPIYVTLNIDFVYLDYTGKKYVFTKSVSRNVQAILINDLRPGSGFRPANGPVDGVFKLH